MFSNLIVIFYVISEELLEFSLKKFTIVFKENVLIARPKKGDIYIKKI